MGALLEDGSAPPFPQDDRTGTGWVMNTPDPAGAYCEKSSRSETSVIHGADSATDQLEQPLPKLVLEKETAHAQPTGSDTDPTTDKSEESPSKSTCKTETAHAQPTGNDIESEPAKVEESVLPFIECVCCSLPGCRQTFVAQLTFGKERRFCCYTHQQVMRLLLLRAKRGYEKTGCSNVLKVERYLRVLITGKPPP